jgi:hypothetical protein
VNPQRLYTILKKRHAKQNQRLLLKQVTELEEYQKEFAEKYKNDTPVASTTAACQLINGCDFLLEHNDMISELFTTLTATTDEQNIEDMNDISSDIKPPDDQSKKHFENRIQVIFVFVYV